MIIKEVLSSTYFKTCVVRKEIVAIDDKDPGTEWKAAYSLIDGSYIGNCKTAEYFEKAGIVPQAIGGKDKVMNKVSSIGFCEKEQKWYGFSHRAVYGFGIGSRIKKGDCGYTPDNIDELFDSVTKKDSSGYRWMEPEDVERVGDGIRLRHGMTRHTTEDPVTGALGGWVEDEPEYQFIAIGRGDWKAKSLKEAKQMAIDFARSVS